jgi:hypothetical protein
MTKEDFLQLQSDHHQSGLSLKSYLKLIGTGYSTYNYWRKKYCPSEGQPHELAPISFRHSSPSPRAAIRPRSSSDTEMSVRTRTATDGWTHRSASRSAPASMRRRSTGIYENAKRPAHMRRRLAARKLDYYIQWFSTKSSPCAR